MTLQNIINSIMAEQEQIDIIHSRIASMKQDLISLHCPVKIDDIVTIEARYAAHRGKKIKVDRIAVASEYRSNKPRYFVVSGNVLRKDGSVGTMRGKYDIDIKPE